MSRTLEAETETQLTGIIRLTSKDSPPSLVLTTSLMRGQSDIKLGTRFQNEHISQEAQFPPMK